MPTKHEKTAPRTRGLSFLRPELRAVRSGRGTGPSKRTIQKKEDETMCIICIKRPGLPMPGKTTLYSLWTRNPDGAGFMYACRGEVLSARAS